MTTTTPAAPVVFADVETTGLALDDQVWEIAAVRRDPDGSQTELHLFVEHDDRKCARLPESFRADHDARFPSACSGRLHTPPAAARELTVIFRPVGGVRPVLVGINPGFDAGHMSRLIRAHRPADEAEPWHYTPVDARHLAVGALLGFPVRFVTGTTPADPMPDGRVLHALPGDLDLRAGTRFQGPPWGSEDVSRALGINPDDFDRHTAMGDVLWAMAIYDAVTNPTHRAAAARTNEED